jgi:hypothetical protein
MQLLSKRRPDFPPTDSGEAVLTGRNGGERPANKKPRLVAGFVSSPPFNNCLMIQTTFDQIGTKLLG